MQLFNEYGQQQIKELDDRYYSIQRFIEELQAKMDDAHSELTAIDAERQERKTTNQAANSALQQYESAVQMILHTYGIKGLDELNDRMAAISKAARGETELLTGSEPEEQRIIIVEPPQTPEIVTGLDDQIAELGLTNETAGMTQEQKAAYLQDLAAAGMGAESIEGIVRQFNEDGFTLEDIIEQLNEFVAENYPEGATATFYTNSEDFDDEMVDFLSLEPDSSALDFLQECPEELLEGLQIKTVGVIGADMGLIDQFMFMVDDPQRVIGLEPETITVISTEVIDEEEQETDQEPEKTAETEQEELNPLQLRKSIDEWINTAHHATIKRISKQSFGIDSKGIKIANLRGLVRDRVDAMSLEQMQAFHKIIEVDG